MVHILITVPVIVQLLLILSKIILMFQIIPRIILTIPLPQIRQTKLLHQITPLYPLILLKMKLPVLILITQVAQILQMMVKQTVQQQITILVKQITIRITKIQLSTQTQQINNLIIIPPIRQILIQIIPTQTIVLKTMKRLTIPRVIAHKQTKILKILITTQTPVIVVIPIHLLMRLIIPLHRV